MAQNSQLLQSKEATLFRHLVQNYESKQYKKGIKAAEQILRKYPNHGDTLAMKALIINSQGKSAEAFELCKLALKNAMKSHVCWHVYGLLYRSVKNYEEAIKAYRFALRLDPESVQIQRDLALLQVHMRDYTGYVQSRRLMLQARPQIRQNWTALAVALHLSGDLKGAEDILHRFEETLKQTPAKSDLEHAEAVLYKNEIIAEEGDIERALEHLDSVSRTAVDKTAVMESRAKYYLLLGKMEPAEKAYRKLLDRNPHHRDYYLGLEKALGLDRSKAEDQQKLGEMYHFYGMKSERIDAARRIPLDFKEGDAFRTHADKYLRRMLRKGVPSTFANVKALYADSAKKETIRELVEGYAAEEAQTNGGAEHASPNGSADASHPKPTSDDTTWHLSIAYFLAQHYDYHLSRDLFKARTHIDKAIALNPSATDYTYLMTSARIIKHLGAPSLASETMTKAREMDLRDRYINTKAAEYALRADRNALATETMGLFTRKEAVGGPLGDLLDMQCMWFITEDGLSYARQGKLSLALKRFTAVYEVFETWQEDQFDFHSFSLRKGMVRAYMDMMRWEDRLREHPFFTRAALAAAKIYIALADDPKLAEAGQMNGVNGAESAADRKKAAKKAKREAEKAELAKKAAEKPNGKAEKDEEGEKKKEDPDPQGLELIKTKQPLEEAMKFLGPVLELSPKDVEGQVMGCEVLIRRRKFLPALKCLIAVQTLESTHPALKALGGRFRLALERLEEPLPPKATEALTALLESHTNLVPAADELESWTKAAFEDTRSARHIQAAVRLAHAWKPTDEAIRERSTKALIGTLGADGTSIEDAVEGLAVLKATGAGADEYAVKAREKWAESEVFGERK